MIAKLCPTLVNGASMGGCADVSTLGWKAEIQVTSKAMVNLPVAGSGSLLFRALGSNCLKASSFRAATGAQSANDMFTHLAIVDHSI